MIAVQAFYIDHMFYSERIVAWAEQLAFSSAFSALPRHFLQSFMVETCLFASLGWIKAIPRIGLPHFYHPEFTYTSATTQVDTKVLLCPS